MATPTVLWKVDENTGTTLNDVATGTAVNLTITPGTGGAWSSIASGFGYTFGTGNAGAPSGSLSGTKIATAFSGLKTFTAEVRCNMTSSGATQTLIYFGDTTGSFAGVAIQNDFGVITVYACGTYVGSWDVGTGLHTYTVVVDTTQATAANRVILYKDGSPVTMTGASYPAQNATIDSSITNYANNRVSLGCEGGVSVTPANSGTIYYGALYASALSSGTVSSNHTALASNNDADPNGPAPPVITAQPATQYVAVGGTPTFTVTATGTGTLSYQWKDRSGSTVGTNSTSYSPGAVTLADSGKSFTVDCTDSNGTTTSSVAYLIVTIDTLPFLFADFTQTGTSFADTGLSFPVAANTDYVFRFALRVWCNATTTGARFQLTGPASPTSVAAGAFIASNTGAANLGVVTALSSSFFATTAGRTNTTPMMVIIEGIFRNGSNAGTLSLQAAAEVASPGAVTVAAGSWGQIAVASGSNFCRITSAPTTTGTTFADVTGLSFSLSASTMYRFRFIVFYTGNATTTGARFGVTTPSSPTSLRVGSQQGSGTAAQDSGSVSAAATVIAASTSGPGSTATWALIEGVIQNGANAGTLQLQSAAEVASPGTVICAVDSYGTLEVVT